MRNFFKLLKLLFYSNFLLLSCSAKYLNDDNTVFGSFIEADKLLQVRMTFEINEDNENGTMNIIFTNISNTNIYIASIENPCVNETFTFSLFDSSGKDLYAEETHREYRPVVRPKRCNRNNRILILPSDNYIVKRIVSLEAGFSLCSFGEKYVLTFEYLGRIFGNHRKKLVEKAAIKSNSINIWIDSTNTIQFDY